MKNFKYLTIFLFAAIAVLTSCSEEIKPSQDGKETAVVYCVLNQNDSIHYVKINKAFFGGGNSNEIALIPDSSYFKSVEATVSEVSSGSVTRTWVLKDTMIENKEPGAFYYPMQKVYYFKTDGSSPLLAKNTVIYKFEADINNGQFTVKGQTNLVEGLNITQPLDQSPLSFVSTSSGKVTYSSATIGFNTGNSSKIEVSLNVEFEELNNSTVLYTKSFNWKIGDYEQDDIKSVMTSGANGQSFYELIVQNVTKNDNNINKRKLKGITIRVSGGNNDLQKYLLVNKPSSSLAQNKISYTNLTVTNEMRVIGIFASRSSFSKYRAQWKYAGGASYYLCIDDKSMNELCKGPISGQYLFCSDSPTYNPSSNSSYKNLYCN